MCGKSLVKYCRKVFLVFTSSVAVLLLLFATAYAEENEWQGANSGSGMFASASLDAISSESAREVKLDVPVAVGGVSVYSASSSIPIPLSGEFRQSEARSMLEMINALRAEVGVAPLQWDSDLEETAMQRAIETTLLFSHNRPSGESCFTAFPEGSAGGENIASGFTSASAAFAGWSASEGHYSNMVSSNFSSIGIACVVSATDGFLYWVQCFSGDDGSGMHSEPKNGVIQYPVYIDDALVSSVSYDSSPMYLGIGSYDTLPAVSVTFSGTSKYGYSLSGSLDYLPGAFEWKVDNGEVAGFLDNGDLIGVTPGITQCTGSMPTTSRVGVNFSVRVIPVARLAGLDALGTMKSIVQMGFSDDSADTAIVATMEGYWDALSASALAGVYDCPVLLTNGASLSDETASELERLGVRHVYVVGGSAAVSNGVVSQIEKVATEPAVTRLAGDIAIETALEIYREGLGDWGNTAVVATSETFQDALSVSPYAYWAKAPIFLANATTHKLDTDVLAELKDGDFDRVVIVGGPAALSKEIEGQIGSIDSIRLYGPTCYETSVEIASWCLEEGMAADGSAIATGAAYYDALTGAALCGKTGSPIVLASDGWTDAMESFISDNAAGIKLAFVLGGPAAISEDVFDRLGTALGY